MTEEQTIFNGELPMIGDSFVKDFKNWTVASVTQCVMVFSNRGKSSNLERIAPGIVVGRLSSIESARCPEDFTVVRETFNQPEWEK